MRFYQVVDTGNQHVAKVHRDVSSSCDTDPVRRCNLPPPLAGLRESSTKLHGQQSKPKRRNEKITDAERGKTGT